MTSRNPWSRVAFNLTEQCRIFRETPERAERLKSEAAKINAADEEAAWTTLRALHGNVAVVAAQKALAAAKRS